MTSIYLLRKTSPLFLHLFYAEFFCDIFTVTVFVSWNAGKQCRKIRSSLSAFLTKSMLACLRRATRSANPSSSPIDTCRGTINVAPQLLHQHSSHKVSRFSLSKAFCQFNFLHFFSGKSSLVQKMWTLTPSDSSCWASKLLWATLLRPSPQYTNVKPSRRPKFSWTSSSFRQHLS